MATQPSLSSEAVSQSGPPARVATLERRERAVSNRVPVPLRIFEILMASAALILSAPLMLFIAAFVRVVSHGPAIFVSRRVGVNQELFTFYKFRTMYADARQRFPELYAYKFSEPEKSKMKFKVDNDPRIIPLGKWLRATSLDELPNFWCVLAGDMALVGPRPEIPEMLPYYHGPMLEKFTVRPGVTGMAQISGRGDLLFHETVACDLEYVQDRCFALDCKILWKTLEAVFSRRGAV